MGKRDWGNTKLANFAIMALLAIFFAVFLILPVWAVAAEGMNLNYIIEISKNPIYREGILNAFAIAFITTIICALLAIPLAILSDSFEFRGKAIVTPLLLVPMILPPFVGALGFVQIFGRFGALNSLLKSFGLIEWQSAPDWLGGDGRFWAVCIAEALHLYPIMYLNVLAALANLDPSLDEAARNLGCGKIRRFFQITLPMIRPGIFAGSSIVFIWSFTELGTPLMLGFNRVSTVQIFNGITELETNPLPYSLVLIVLLVSCGLYSLSRITLGKNADATPVKAMVGARCKKIYGIYELLVLLPFLLLSFLASLPHLGMIFLSISANWYRSFLPSSYTVSHFREALSHALVVPSIINSLRFSLIAMFIALGIGIIIALLTVRWKHLGWQIFDIFGMMPLAVPGIVLAFGYMSMSIRYDWVRSMMDPLKNPSILLVIAYAMRRLPYVLRSVAAGLQQSPPELEDVARNLGANEWTVLREITVPLIMANIVIGALFAFSFSMLEVSDSLILAQKTDFFPVTRAIYELSQILGSGAYLACAFGVWAMCFLATTLIIASSIMGKTLGSLFRF